MNRRMLVAQVFAGPYVAEIHDYRGWFMRRFEVEIWGDRDFLCYTLKSGVREALCDLAAREARRLQTNAGQVGAKAEFARVYGQHLVEVCRETAALVAHLA
jgi:hypothetical protein